MRRWPLRRYTNSASMASANPSTPPSPTETPSASDHANSEAKYPPQQSGHVMTEIIDALHKLAHEYPEWLVENQLMDVPRAAFHVGLVMGAAGSRRPSDVELCDMGSGIGIFTIGCALAGAKRVVMVDDFNDPVNHKIGESVLELHRGRGVHVVARDVVKQGIADLDGQFDVISTFDSMEHWHNSPKRLFHQVFEKLKPGGAFVLGVPNCANLRKRVAAPLGRNKWSAMGEWYETETFRGHVREPDVADLRYIARDMGLVDVRIYGRNWLGHHSRNPVIRLISNILDHPLRLRPTLCSDLYMVGRKATSIGAR